MFLRFFPENVIDTFGLFETLEIDFVAASPKAAFCCGYPLHAAGYRDRFRALAVKSYEELRRYKTILTGCPACAYTFKVEYANLGLDLGRKVEHISEFLLARQDRLRGILTRKFPRVVQYHDPCYLGRYLGQYEPPRNLLRLACREQIREFSWKKDQSYCCGGGGAFGAAHPEEALKIAEQRVREFQESFAEVLVSVCPSCQRQFQKVLGGAKVMDLVNLLAACTEG